MGVTTVQPERARTILNYLVHQRQLMREGVPDDRLLEANRLGIIYWQRQLSRALSSEQRKTEIAA